MKLRFGKFLLIPLFALLGSSAAHAQTAPCANYRAVDQQGIVADCTSGGVQAGQVVSLNASGLVVPVTANATSGSVAISLENRLIVGATVRVLIEGNAPISVDNICAIGNIVEVGITGNGHCVASSPSTQVIGIATSASASTAGGSITVQVSPLSSAGTTSAGGAVSSVFGRSGAVVATLNDYNFNQLAGSAACGQLPALTGDATTSAGSCGTTVAKVNGAAVPASATVLATNSSSQPTAAPLPSADLWVGSAGNLPVAVVITGDASLTNSGVWTNTKINGNSAPAGAAAHQIYVATAANSFALKTIPDCQDSAGNHLNYTQSTDLFSCGTSTPLALQVNGTPNGSQTLLNLVPGANIAITDDGVGDVTIALTGVVPAPATQAKVSGKVLCGYTQSTGAWTLCNLATVSPQQGTTDTLTNASLTTEQLFATNLEILANTLITNVAFQMTAIFDTTVTGTGSNATMKAYLCPTQGSLTGCVKIYTSTTSTPSVLTQSATVPIVIVGTAAAGATATVIAGVGTAGGASTPIGINRQSSIITSVPTNGNLFLQFTIQYANTTTSDSMTYTALVMGPGPII